MLSAVEVHIRFLNLFLVMLNIENALSTEAFEKGSESNANANLLIFRNLG